MSDCPQSCDLCGLPLRHRSQRLLSSGKRFHFCCMGCKQVFRMLLEASGGGDPASFKDSELFRKCREMGIIPASEADVDRRSGPVEGKGGEVSRAEGGGESLSLSLRVRDMWCPACAWVIEETLKRMPGVQEAKCHFSTDTLVCDYDPIMISPPHIVQVVQGLGYRAFPPGETSESRERRGEFIRFFLSAFLTVNVMMLSFCLYSGFFTALSPDTIQKLSWPIFGMASIVLFYGGRRIYQRAWAGLSSALFGMETLITVGAFSAYLYSTYNLLTGSIHLYYDTASMLITLVLLGKTLEGTARGRFGKTVEGLNALRPSKVKIRPGGALEGRYVSAAQLREGDLFQITEGETVAADGVIVEGEGSIDESSLTGESLPLVRRTGERLRSGTRVIRGEFTVRAEKVGEDSLLGQMLQVMDRALTRETPIEGRTDRLLRWFVPGVLLLAGGTGLGCLLAGLSPEEAIVRSVTVLVISCPCTLGIAIPLARVAGISLAGKAGLLVRDFSAFEQVEKVKTFVFDKTGTVTLGRWRLLGIVPLGGLSEEEILGYAAALEKGSDHAIAAEILERAEEAFARQVEAREIRTRERGISGRIGPHEVRIGSEDFAGIRPERGAWADRKPPEGGDPGTSRVFMSVDGEGGAVLIFGDRIREEAGRVVGELKTAGYGVALVSGDGEETTKAVGREIGISSCHGRRMPLEKAILIRDLQQGGERVAMVGDGVNDTPALVQADLAMAVYSGYSLGGEAADVTLMRADLRQIPDFLGLARTVNRKIRQNLAFSFLYNTISIPIAMSGLLNPIVAVTAMLLSSLTVVGNTLRISSRLLKKAC